MSRKKRPGRPKLPVSERSAAVVTVRVTRTEKRELEDAARKAGLTLSEWLRQKLLAESPDLS